MNLIWLIFVLLLNFSESFTFNLLANVFKIHPLRNFVIYSMDCPFLADYVKKFYSFNVPVVLVELGRKKLENENYNSSSLDRKENIMGHHFNLNLIVLDKVDHFERVLHQIASLHHFKSRRFFIFLGDFNENQIKIYSRYACKKFWITTVTFVNAELTEFKRFNPYNETMLITRSDASIVFENFANNFYGNKLRIAMLESVASSVWKNDHFEGRDGIFLYELLKYFNASGEYIFMPSASYGQTFPNGTVTGMIEKIYNKTADASFNSRQMFSQFAKKIDFTYPHDKSEIVIVLPRNYGKVRDIYSNLTIGMHLLIIFSFLTYIIYLKFYCNHSAGRIFLILVEILSSHSVKIFPVKFYRLTLIYFVVISFYIATIFQAKVISFQTVPVETPHLKTLKEIRNSSFNLNIEIIAKNAIAYFNGHDHEDVTTTILQKSEILPSRAFIEKFIKCSENNAFISLKLLLQAYNNFKNDSKRNCHYTLEQPIVPIYLAFAVRYGSPILEKINKFIFAINENGIRPTWDRKYMKPEPKFNTEPIKLSLKNLYNYFKFLFNMYIFSIIIFFIEVLIYKLKSYKIRLVKVQ